MKMKKKKKKEKKKMEEDAIEKELHLQVSVLRLLDTQADYAIRMSQSQLSNKQTRESKNEQTTNKSD
ncbi:hypothetical protein WN51_11658 [Melipona quadrifasciata]|uniref:Uncharacterized protein n=1 Tax=Melipona quadrifasciata TaxID=166423 RepID=A0A0M9A3A1_9HYME|nr:hypothetical protein WN51_11658 [Melipona quadrifasciata]